MTDRSEFSKAVKRDAIKRAGWPAARCEKCTALLSYGKFHFHHIKECAFGGSNELDNCRVLCTACHSKITGSQAAVIAKTNRVRNKNLGIRTWRKPMIGSKDSPWKKTFNNGWVRR